ncbi:MAG: ribosome-associated translation inhibitor RaiA [Rhodospirillales bacterium]|nr:ribosome-associated translation inhibitor RaiA [Rhodospirillales bacterium]
MELSIKGRGLDVGLSLRTHVQEQLEVAVAKYFAKAHDAVVTVSRDGHAFRVDISVHPTRGLLVQGQGSAGDAYAAFDSAFERISKQLRRYKRRLVDHHRNRGSEPPETTPAQQYIIASEAVEEELPADGQPAIIAELPTEIATLSVGEAVMRLDLADLPAMMFRNQANGVLNVVYRRPDGNIGWIDPANTRAT